MSAADPQFLEETIVLSHDVFKCTICKCIQAKLFCPTRCQHTVCSECVEGLKRNRQFNICQTCRTPVDEWVPHVFAMQIISGIKVKCEHANCNTILQFGDYQAHFGSCAQRPVECARKHAGCDWSGTWANSLDHNPTCQYVLEQCRHCKNQFVRGAIQGHDAVCNYALYRCMKCNCILPVWRMSQHVCCDDEEKKEHEEKLPENNPQFVRVPVVDDVPIFYPSRRAFVAQDEVDQLSLDAIQQLAIEDGLDMGLVDVRRRRRAIQQVAQDIRDEMLASVADEQLIGLAAIDVEEMVNIAVRHVDADEDTDDDTDDEDDEVVHE